VLNGLIEDVIALNSDGDSPKKNPLQIALALEKLNDEIYMLGRATTKYLEYKYPDLVAENGKR